MKFALYIVVLTIMVSVEAAPTPGIELPPSDPDYFKENLKSVQGAIKDTLRAGQDLEEMEKVLQKIVNLSSHFWRAESATEFATASNAYANGWKSGGEIDTPDELMRNLIGITCSQVKEFKYCGDPAIDALTRCPISCPGVLESKAKGKIGDSCGEDADCESNSCRPVDGPRNECART